MVEKIEQFEKNNIISFSNRRELIQFVTEYFVNSYKKYLLQDCIATMDSVEEIYMWGELYQAECMILAKKIKKKLNKEMFFKNRIEIDRETFQMVVNQKTCLVFPKNVRYEIRDLTLKKFKT